MRLIALGTSAAYPEAGSACSGYLVSAQGTNVLLDCGTGVLAQLQRVLAPGRVDAIVISHLHADHFLDIVPFRYALWRSGRSDRPVRPALWLPPGGPAATARLVSAWGAPESFFSEHFDISEYAPRSSLVLGALTLTFAPVRHYVPAYGVRVRGGSTLAYSSDSAPCSELTDLARGADVLLCEAALDDAAEEPPDKRGHMSPAEAGELAAEAGVRLLLLSHFWPGADRAAAAHAAARGFRGNVCSLQDMDEVSI